MLILTLTLLYNKKNVLNKLRQVYSVMQSDGNSFGGDVVFGSFNKACRDEDSIQENIYVKQIFRNFNMKIQDLKGEKCTLKEIQHSTKRNRE